MRISKNIICAIIFMQAVTSCLLIVTNTSKKFDILYPITHIKEFDVKGIVFSDTTEFPFLSQMNPKNFFKRFSPTFEDVVLFETVFHENYSDFRKTQSYYIPQIEITGKMYQEWGRHYFGYIDKTGQRFLLIYLTKLELRKEWTKWKQGPYVQLPGQWSLFFNLDTKQLLGWSEINR